MKAESIIYKIRTLLNSQNFGKFLEDEYRIDARAEEMLGANPPPSLDKYFKEHSENTRREIELHSLPWRGDGK